MPNVSFCTVIIHTWTPHPLQAALDDWMVASRSAALVHWPSPARQTAQTGFCGRKHSCKQVWQNLLTVGGKKSILWFQRKRTDDLNISRDTSLNTVFAPIYFLPHADSGSSDCFWVSQRRRIPPSGSLIVTKESNIKQNNILHSWASLLGTPCLQKCLNSLWNKFNKALGTFLKDFAPC